MKNPLKYLRRKYQSIKNIIRWWPIIWKDRDWDNWFIEEILVTKLEHQAAYFEQHGHTLSANYDAEKMRLVIKLLRRCQEEYYQSEYMGFYEDDYFIDNAGLLHWTEPTLDNLGAYFDKYPRINKIVCANQGFGPDDRLKIALKIGQINHQRAYELAYKIMGRYSYRWWD